MDKNIRKIVLCNIAMMFIIIVSFILCIYDILKEDVNFGISSIVIMIAILAFVEGYDMLKLKNRQGIYSGDAGNIKSEKRNLVVRIVAFFIFAVYSKLTYGLNNIQIAIIAVCCVLSLAIEYYKIYYLVANLSK